MAMSRGSAILAKLFWPEAAQVHVSNVKKWCANRGSNDRGICA